MISIPWKYKSLMLLISVILGLLGMIVFIGKSNITLDAVVVSPDEQYIACFETGRGSKIRCFHADGSLSFDYDVPVDISEGGYCSLWFEDSKLCALFYRPDKIIRFAMDGTILEIVNSTIDETPPKYPSFYKKERRYIYDGNQIDVIYNKKGFFGYWLFGAERCLTITSENGGERIVYAWTAKNGIVQEAQVA